MRGQDLSDTDVLRFGAEDDPLGHKLGERRLVRMLELATAAFTEVSAGWFNVMRPASGNLTLAHFVTRQCTGNVCASRRYAVPACGKADNLFIFGHRQLL